MRYYIRLNSENIITDAISYEHEGYIGIDVPEPLPAGVNGGWYKWKEEKLVEHLELKPIAIDDKIDLLLQVQGLDLGVAKREIEVKNKINTGKIVSTNFNDLPEEEKQLAKLSLFKTFSPKPEDISKSLSAIEFSLVILSKVMNKAFDRTKLSENELILWDAFVSTMSLNDMPIDNNTDWRYQYLQNEFETTQINRQSYFVEKMRVVGEL